MSDVKLNKHGTNAGLKAHILSDEKMRQLGFTDKDKDVWYFVLYWDDIDISFNIYIEKDDPDNPRVEVLDEQYLQFYDYQYILSCDPDFKVAKLVKERADNCMTYFIDNGVFSGWQVGDYL